MNKWFKSNLWNFIFTGASLILAWGFLSARVNALEKFQTENKPLIERFYQLEERDKSLIDKVNIIDKKIDTIIEQYIDLRKELR